MLKTKRLEILLTDEEKCRFGERFRRRRIVATVKNRKLGNGTARWLNRQHLLAPIGRTLENPHVTGLHDEESGARLAFGKDQFSASELALNNARAEKRKLGFR